MKYEKEMIWVEKLFICIAANIRFQGIWYILLIKTSVRPFICPFSYSFETMGLFSMKIGIKMHLAIGIVFMYAWWPWDEGQGRYEGKNPIYT